MSFLNPSFLFALIAVSIPIIIHLFHFRRFKKVYFSNINFLERLSDETQKQARLKHWLVLISRILAITFLVLAFARPIIPLKDTTAGLPDGNKLSVFIDNSFSMEAGTPFGSLLDQSKQYAGEIAAIFDPTDKFQLLTNDFEARHQRFVGRDEFIAMVNEVSYSPEVRNINDVMLRQRELLEENMGSEQKLAFILSDFQKNIVQLSESDSDENIEYFLIPFQAERPSNLFIDTVWIENPVRMSEQIITLETRIFNDSDEALQNQPVRLYINNAQRAVATFDIAPRSHAQVSLTYTLGTDRIQQGYVELTDHPVTFDDRYYFSFTLSENIPVLIINQSSNNRFLNALLSSDTTFIVRNIQESAIDFSQFGSQNLIILNEINAPRAGLIQELTRYVEQGGNLLVFPSENADMAAYNQLFQSLGVSGYTAKDTQETRVTSINEMHSIYTNVFDRLPENIDLPVVNQYYVFDRQTRGREQYLMQLQNGNYFLTSTPSGQGTVYVSAVPANDNFSNFPRHPMFVPTIYNIALHSASFYPLSYTIGIDEFVGIRNYQPTAGGLFKITSNQQEIIPESRNINNNIQLMLHGQIRESGNYNLMGSNENLRMLSFNYDRRESLLESYDKGELETLVAGFENKSIFVLDAGQVAIDKQLELLRGGRQLWKIFLLIGLLFLLTEVLLLRFLK